MIVKNEEKNLANILSSVKNFADEIIIVDTGSTDKTKQIAQDFTQKVYDFEWNDDFSAARNFSFSKAQCQFVMWLDADDIILPCDEQKILALKNSKEKVDVYMLKYVAAYDENFMPTFSYFRERIVKNFCGFVWRDPVHEVIVPKGRIKYENINIFHAKKSEFTSRNLNIYRKMIALGEKMSARQKFYYSRELMYNGLLDEAICSFSEYLSYSDGWAVNKIEACKNLASCYVSKGETANALTALLGSFVYGVPRGEVAYEIGNIFFSLKRYNEAIYWYQIARKSKKDLKSCAFVNIDDYDINPILQLCSAEYRLGHLKKAKTYHNMAKRLQPNHPSVIYNEKVFNSEKV